MRCDGTVVALAGLGGDGVPRPIVARHVATCLRCQAEQARRRRLRRLLAQLRADQAALGPGVLASVLDAIDAAAGEDAAELAHRRGHPWRASLAAGAGAAAVLVLTGWARLARQGEPASRCYR